MPGKSPWSRLVQSIPRQGLPSLHSCPERKPLRGKVGPTTSHVFTHHCVPAVTPVNSPDGIGCGSECHPHELYPATAAVLQWEKLKTSKHMHMKAKSKSQSPNRPGVAKTAGVPRLGLRIMSVGWHCCWHQHDNREPALLILGSSVLGKAAEIERQD